MEQHTVSFTVPKDDFSSALAWVARSLPSKPTQPILRGVMIEADDDGLHLSGFDREVSTRVHINAEVDEPGSILVAGKLVSDEITDEIVAQRLSQPDAASGWLLDGYPRNLHQVSALDEAGHQVDAVISLVVDEEQLVARLLKRAEIDAIRQRPHPYEFDLYYTI